MKPMFISKQCFFKKMLSNKKKLQANRINFLYVTQNNVHKNLLEKF